LDLIRAIEDTTGRNLRRLFDEWVYGAGHPEFELSYQWHDDKKMAEIVVEQKQTDGRASITKDAATTHLFHLPVIVEATVEGGKKVTQRIELGEARERIFVSVPSKPLMIRFDPENWIPKTLKFPRPKEMLIYQLQNDPDCMGRIEAAKELGKIADPDVVAALAKAVSGDPFWGVQAEAAGVLAEIRTDAARDALLAGVSAKNPKARRAIARALGAFRDEKASSALRKLAEKDESYYVEADSTHAWVLSRSRVVPPPSPAEVEATEKFLLGQLEKESYREVVRGAAYRGLAELPGVGRGERPKAVQAVIDGSRRGKPLDARLAAIMALGKVSRSAVPAESNRILEVFRQLAEEDSFRIRVALVTALEESENPDGLPILEWLRAHEIDGRVRRHALVAIDAVRAAGSTPESVSNLKAALEKLEEEHRKLKAGL
jgi:aminopeptidase N